jgi:hypothetical protein
MSIISPPRVERATRLPAAIRQALFAIWTGAQDFLDLARAIRVRAGSGRAMLIGFGKFKMGTPRIGIASAPGRLAFLLGPSGEVTPVGFHPALLV